MTVTQTLAELSRAVAEKKGWKQVPCLAGLPECFHWTDDSAGSYWDSSPDFTDPARLFDLEGELQKAGWSFDYATNDPDGGWVAMNPHRRGVGFKYPATAEGRARLILRAYLEMKETSNG